jgi:hypothetical protein
MRKYSALAGTSGVALMILAHNRAVPVAVLTLLAARILAQKRASPRAEPLRAAFRRRHIPGAVDNVYTVHKLAYFHRNAEKFRETK